VRLGENTALPLTLCFPGATRYLGVAVGPGDPEDGRPRQNAGSAFPNALLGEQRCGRHPRPHKVSVNGTDVIDCLYTGQWVGRNTGLRWPDQDLLRAAGYCWPDRTCWRKRDLHGPTGPAGDCGSLLPDRTCRRARHPGDPGPGRRCRRDRCRWRCGTDRNRQGIVATGAFEWQHRESSRQARRTYVFIGGTAVVTTTATQRLTGAGVAALGTTSATAADFMYGLCYRASGSANPPVNFVGACTRSAT